MIRESPTRPREARGALARLARDPSRNLSREDRSRAALEPTKPEAEPPAPLPASPPAPEFDPATAPAAKVRVVAVPDRRRWTPCGVIHSTGAIEVEVLEVGEPPPRLVLIISCPVDFHARGSLEVGAILSVEFWRRKQSWPRPAADRKLSPVLARRYIKSIAVVEAPK